MIGAYGYQLHGVWIGVALGLLAVVLMILLMSEESDGLKVLRKLHRIKWAIFALIMIGIALSGMETINIG